MRFSDLTQGVALKLVLDRLGNRPVTERPAGRRGRARGPSAGLPRAPAKRGPLFGLMLASIGLAVPLMIIFEHPITRIIGVLGLFTFIVSGVFVIADPAFLEGEEDS
jgi:hypothetical protein